jgi:hypothetical protein
MNFFYSITTEGFEGTVITSIFSFCNLGMRLNYAGAMYIADYVKYISMNILR